VKEYLPRGRNFWELKIPSSCSWSWKKLFSLRDNSGKFLQFHVGVGKDIFLWLDSWHLHGILLKEKIML
jgi:hypothetical protein